MITPSWLSSISFTMDIMSSELGILNVITCWWKPGGDSVDLQSVPLQRRGASDGAFADTGAPIPSTHRINIPCQWSETAPKLLCEECGKARGGDLFEKVETRRQWPKNRELSDQPESFTARLQSLYSLEMKWSWPDRVRPAWTAVRFACAAVRPAPTAAPSGAVAWCDPNRGCCGAGCSNGQSIAQIEQGIS